jgi:hypothetical protein
VPNFSLPAPQWKEKGTAAALPATRLAPQKVTVLGDEIWVFLPEVSTSRMVRDDALGILLFDEDSAGVGTFAFDLGARRAPNYGMGSSFNRTTVSAFTAMGGNMGPVNSEQFFGLAGERQVTELRPTKLPDGSIVFY